MILLLDNYDSFTWNLVQSVGEVDPSIELGRGLLVVRNDQITVGDVDRLDSGRGPTHIIISPGPCSPRESGVSTAIIEAFAGRVPILGVCLGHQCLGAVHGMTITRHPPMHGKTSLIHHDGRGVFAGVPSPFEAMRYHSLIVNAESVPPDWEVSAWTEERGERLVMGLRRKWGREGAGGRAPLEGVQFHPESFLTPCGPQLLANFLGLPAIHSPP
ncbi:MAG: aminodeoxychorismate/anthranilate synthase component II [Phycisphaeraceae bacterium]|nr:aminodeoxychorismate/anthranilate synthase component II [Phycisphaeraceae bacterium]